MDLKTASQAKRHYDPLPPQFVRFNDKMYCYNFTRLTNRQVILAEELANLKKMRLDAFSDNTNIPNSEMDLEYVGDLVSILFVPSPDEKPRIFSPELQKTTKKDFFESTDPDKLEEIERCLRDFFMRRGKRMIVSATLMRLGSSDRMITRMMAQAASIYSKSPSKESGSTIPGNTAGDVKTVSETPPSGS